MIVFHFDHDEFAADVAVEHAHAALARAGEVYVSGHFDAGIFLGVVSLVVGHQFAVEFVRGFGNGKFFCLFRAVFHIRHDDFAFFHTGGFDFFHFCGFDRIRFPASRTFAFENVRSVFKLYGVAVYEVVPKLLGGNFHFDAADFAEVYFIALCGAGGGNLSDESGFVVRMVVPDADADQFSAFVADEHAPNAFAGARVIDVDGHLDVGIFLRVIRLVVRHFLAVQLVRRRTQRYFIRKRVVFVHRIGILHFARVGAVFLRLDYRIGIILFVERGQSFRDFLSASLAGSVNFAALCKSGRGGLHPFLYVVSHGGFRFRFRHAADFTGMYDHAAVLAERPAFLDDDALLAPDVSQCLDNVVLILIVAADRAHARRVSFFRTGGRHGGFFVVVMARVFHARKSAIVAYVQIDAQFL